MKDEWRKRNPEKAKEVARRWREANREKTRSREEQPHRRYSKAKSRAKYKGQVFTITEDEYTLLIQTPCFYCLGFFNPTKTAGGLDRIDNSKGYESSNVLPCCGSCNRTRGDRFTVEEAKAMIQFVISLRRQNA